MMKAAFKRWWASLQRPVKRQRGIALIVVAVTVSVLGAVVGEFDIVSEASTRAK